MKLLSLICVLTYTLIFHPLKCTFSKVTFQNKENITIETRFFLDDLSEHLAASYRLKHADFSQLDSSGSQALQRYINERYYLLVNSEKINLQIDRLHVSKDRITLNVFLSATATPTDNIIIYNNLLTEVFMNQEHKLIYNSKHFTLNKYQPELKLP